MQFCSFLKALVGVEEMQRMMVQAIGVAEADARNPLLKSSFRRDWLVP